jgi:hypothetical protein
MVGHLKLGESLGKHAGYFLANAKQVGIRAGIEASSPQGCGGTEQPEDY